MPYQSGCLDIGSILNEPKITTEVAIQQFADWKKECSYASRCINIGTNWHVIFPSLTYSLVVTLISILILQ